MIAQATARIAALFSRSAAPGRFSGDVRGTLRPSHRPAFFALPFTTALLALALVAIALAAAASASAAGAAKTVIGTFGSAGTGAGQFENPRGLAVDQSTHDVYVADSGNNRISVFDSIGTFVRAFGQDVALGAPA